jgi:hypothetical protein
MGGGWATLAPWQASSCCTPMFDMSSCGSSNVAPPQRRPQTRKQAPTRFGARNRGATMVGMHARVAIDRRRPIYRVFATELACRRPQRREMREIRSNRIAERGLLARLVRVKQHLRDAARNARMLLRQPGGPCACPGAEGSGGEGAARAHFDPKMTLLPARVSADGRVRSVR